MLGHRARGPSSQTPRRMIQRKKKSKDRLFSLSKTNGQVVFSFFQFFFVAQFRPPLLTESLITTVSLWIKKERDAKRKVERNTVRMLNSYLK